MPKKRKAKKAKSKSNSKRKPLGPAKISKMVSTVVTWLGGSTAQTAPGILAIAHPNYAAFTVDVKRGKVDEVDPTTEADTAAQSVSIPTG